MENKTEEIVSAIEDNNFKGFKKLITNKDELRLKDNYGRHLIHLAASSSLTITKYLVENGADINAVDERGKQPIHEAAKSGEFEIVKYLVSNGANVNATSNSGVQLISQIAEDLETDNYLSETISKSNNYTKHIISESKDKTLIERPTNNINKSSDKYNALRNNKIEIIKYLTYSGANINAINNDGVTVLMNLVKNCTNLEFIKYIIRKNKDINHSDSNGTTALMYAGMYNKNSAIAKELIDNGANIRSTDNDGMSALHLATAFTKQTEIIDFFLKYLNLKDRDSNGNTPLLSAIEFNNKINIVKYLIKKGAKLSVVNYKKENASDIAFNCSVNKDLFDLIIKRMKWRFWMKKKHIME